MRQWRTCLAWLTAALLLGCATAPRLRVKPPAPVDGWGIAVMPFDMDYPSSTEESYARSLEVANHLAQTTRLLVYGPGEFNVTAPDENDLRKGTDLLKRVHYTQERAPERFLALRLSATETRHLRPESRKAEVTVVVRAELLSLASPKVLAAVEGHLAKDTDATLQGGDPWPALTALTVSLVDTLVDAAGFEKLARSPLAGFEFITAPRPSIDFLPASGDMKKPHSLEKEAHLLRAIDGLDPTASEDRRALYKDEPWGLLVVSPSPKGKMAQLLPDDFLIDAAGDPLLGEYVLIRQLRDGPARLRLKRGGVVLGAELSP